ncbi:uncharacterized protein EAF01_004311 [Botrytis porri]|uniref:Protein kinase domain-containing protein n=1 Tax=Botrytis porri TaxID=87229 RepID=A0A4Z1KGE1_9HELO|nr:uncharacterized protein EAF01_004311 [Botrytis porri]KAF7908556.1 hypothetical protein EAF01_004311 [Botrytis porri]TGO84598.1 hypothetical protein BPOR_0487g00100 [Botrytis porri]
MTESDASRIQSSQAKNGGDMSSAGFAARFQAAGDHFHDTIVINFGMNVAAAEFANQQYIWEHSKSNKAFRVPQPIRYFQDKSLGPHLCIGYLVMEFIHGTNLSSYLESTGTHDQEEVVNRLLRVLDHLESLPPPNGHTLGPVGGGPLRGYLWSDDGVNIICNFVLELQDFLNTIIRDYTTKRDSKLGGYVNHTIVDGKQKSAPPPMGPPSLTFDTQN